MPTPETHRVSIAGWRTAGFSPLLLADRLLTLAQEADRAGLSLTATRLVRLAHDVCDEPPNLHH